MTKIRELNALQRRDLLASDRVSQEDLTAYGQQYFEQESFYEAFQFFERAGDLEGLNRCKQVAIEQADAELLWQVAHSDRADVTNEEWRDCAETAIRLDKHSVAAYVFRRLGDGDALNALPKQEGQEDPSGP